MKYLSDKQVLVVVADSARARLCSTDPDSHHLVEAETLVNPSVRLPSREAVSDRPGRTFDRSGGARHALVEPTDAKTKSANLFSDQVTERIELLVKKNQFKKIAIVAAPKILGMLRQKLSPSNRALVTCEINKDLTTSDIETIERVVIEKMRGF